MKTFIENILAAWFKWLMFINTAFTGKRYLYFIDIDNTLADTYPSLLKQHPSERERLLNLPPHNNMIRILKNSFNAKRKYVFISARSYKQYFTTVEWLKKQGLPANLLNTIIVKTPQLKISLIQNYYVKGKTIVIDDLTYNHEHGIVKYYQQEIDMLQKLKLKHIGYSTILKINSTKP